MKLILDAKDKVGDWLQYHFVFGDVGEADINYDPEGASWHICHMKIDEHCRNQGYGKAMFYQLLEWAKKDGIVLLSLEVVDVYGQDIFAKTLSFWRSCGFIDQHYIDHFLLMEREV